MVINFTLIGKYKYMLIKLLLKSCNFLLEKCISILQIFTNLRK